MSAPRVPKILMWLLMGISILITTACGGAIRGTKSNDTMTCLNMFTKSAKCNNIIQNSLPVNRYSCRSVSKLVKCHRRSVGVGCWDAAIGSKRLFLQREKAMARILYPGQECKYLREKKTRKNSSVEPLKCTPQQELDMNILIDGCAGFVLSSDMELLKYPCQALEEYINTCLDIFLPRCSDKNTPRYETLALVNIGNFLSNLASELPKSTLKVSKCEALQHWHLENEVFKVHGAKYNPNRMTEFQDDPKVKYFDQSWDMLFNLVLDGSFLLPRGMNISREELVDIMKADRLDLMKPIEIM